MRSIELFATLLAVSSATPLPGARDVGIFRRDYDPLSTSSSTIPLKRLPMRSSFNEQSNLFRRQSSPTAPLTRTSQDVVHTNVTFGNQTFPLVLDTGSSETFVMGKGFQCQDTLGNDVSISNCTLEGLYSRSGTFQEITDETFFESFGDRNSVTGIVGEESITLGGVEVTQKVSVLSKGFFDISLEVSGLLGLSYPSLSTIYQGPDIPSPNDTNPYNYTNLVIHNPLVHTMFVEGKIPAAVFTITMDRSDGGSLTLGGIPAQFASAHFTTSILPSLTALKGEERLVNRFYNISVAGLTINGESNKTSLSAIADSGTGGLTLPPEIAAAVNNGFDPPAQFNETLGLYTVNCSATAPQIAITIEETPFAINPQDLILPIIGDFCLAAVSPNTADQELNILGGAFLKNVVAVYDIGKNQMHFAPNP